MQSVCPRCGGPVNARPRGMSIAAPRRERHREWPNFIYECVDLDCKWATFDPPQVHEDRIEWFGNTILWPAMKVLGALFLLAFLAQILGLI